MEWITTSSLLRDLRRSSDSDAWTQLARRFHMPIVRFARQMGHSAADAEDLAQDTLAAFVEAYRAGRYDRRKGRLSKWLFGIAYRQSCKARSAARRADQLHRSAATYLAERMERSRGDASRLWEQEWEVTMMADCLRRVRAEVEPQTFRVFELVVLEGRSPEDVADSLNIPRTVVYNAKHRVIVRCRYWRAMLERIEEQNPPEIGARGGNT